MSYFYGMRPVGYDNTQNSCTICSSASPGKEYVPVESSWMPDRCKYSRWVCKACEQAYAINLAWEQAEATAQDEEPSQNAPTRLEWSALGEDTHTDVCGALRGPRGRVWCERDRGHEGFHTGRGQSGQYFAWEHGYYK